MTARLALTFVQRSLDLEIDFTAEKSGGYDDNKVISHRGGLTMSANGDFNSMIRAAARKKPREDSFWRQITQNMVRKPTPEQAFMEGYQQGVERAIRQIENPEAHDEGT